MDFIACIESIPGTEHRFLFYEHDVVERVRRAAAEGFAGVDFWDWRDKDMERVCEAAADSGVFVNAVFGYRRGNLIDPDDWPLIEDQLEASLQASRRLGWRCLSIFSDEIGPGGVCKEPGRWLSAAQRHLNAEAGMRRLAQLAKRVNPAVTLIFEPINHRFVRGYSLWETAACAQVIRNVNAPNLRLIFDLFHHGLTQGSLLDTLSATLDVVSAVHVADVPGRHEPGTGEIRIQAVWDLLQASGFQGDVAFECSPITTTERALSAIQAIFPVGHR